MCGGKRYPYSTDREKGQSLVEVLVVAAILGLMLTGIMSIVVISVSNNRKLKARTVAVRLAQEGVDWVRSQRDSMSWIEFDNKLVSADHNYCLKDLSYTWDNLTLNCGGNDTFTVGQTDFTRYADFTYLGDDAGDPPSPRYELELVVTWNEAGTDVNTSINSNIVRRPN